MFEQVWPSITQIMQTQFNDAELIGAICEYLIKLGRALKAEFVPCFASA